MKDRLKAVSERVVKGIGLGCVALLAACAGADGQEGGADNFGTPCLVDTDCQGGLECILVDDTAGYLCTQGCTSDASCPDDATCVETVLGAFCSTEPRPDGDGFLNPEPNPGPNPEPTPEAEPNPEPEPEPEGADCTEDAQCGDGLCLGGTCVDRGEGCRQDADCGVGRVCDEGTSRCVQGMTEGCQPDRFEPNNNLGQAEAIQPGQLDNLTICAGDEDYFTLTVGANASLQARATFDPEGGILGMQLLDSQGQSLQTTLGNNGVVSLSRQITQGGAYRLRVFGQSPIGENTYALNVSTNGVNPGCQDDLSEPNENSGQAPRIGNGVLNLVACSGSQDWFRFTAEQGAAISATIAFTHAEGNLDLFLFQSDGVTRLAASQTTANQERVSASAPVAGEYVLQIISDRAEGSSGYTLTLSGAGEVNNNNGACPDPLEPNNSAGAARTLTEGFFPSLSICPSDPTDWYAVNLVAGQEIAAELFTPDFSATLIFEVVDVGGVRVVGGGVALFGLGDATYTATQTGTHYLRVTHLLGETVTYDMDFFLNAVAEPPACAADRNEPNDTSLDAVALDGTISGAVACPNDSDFYQIEVTEAGAELTVTATFDTIFGDVDLALLGSDGTTEIARATTRGGTERLARTIDTPGTYFIRAFLGAGQNTTYSLSTSSTFEPTCNDRFEPNNNAQTATPVSSGTYEGLDLCDTESQDWFAIAVSGSSTLNIDIFFDGQLADIDLELYSTNGTTELASSASVTDTESISEPITASGVYFIRVLHYRGSPNAYRMVIDAVDLDTNCTEDAFEDDDSPAQARAASPGTFTGHLCAGDPDHFQFNANAGQQITATLTFSTAQGNLALTLLDTNGTTTLRSQDGSTGTETLVWPVATTGDYTLRVTGGGLANADYSLAIALTDTPDQTPCNDRFEPNNSAQTAPRIAAGRYDDLDVCADDDNSDFYAVEISSAATLQIDAFFSHAGGDIDMRLLDINGTTVLASAISSSDNEQIVRSITQPGVYTIEVYGFLGDVTNSYDLNVEIR